MMLRTPVCSYPIVTHLSFNFLCLLLLYSIYLNVPYSLSTLYRDLNSTRQLTSLFGPLFISSHLLYISCSIHICCVEYVLYNRLVYNRTYVMPRITLICVQTPAAFLLGCPAPLLAGVYIYIYIMLCMIMCCQLWLLKGKGWAP